MTTKEISAAKRIMINSQLNEQPSEKLVDEYISLLKKLSENHSNNLNSTALIPELARKMAASGHRLKLLKSLDAADINISLTEFMLTKRKQILKLQKALKEIIEVFESGFFPDPNIFTILLNKPPTTDTYKNLKTIPINNRLEKIIVYLESHIPGDKPFPEAKKTKGPLRLDFIYNITEAWKKITGLPPEKFKTDTANEPYGKFYDFIKEAIAISGLHIGLRDAIKDSVQLFEEIGAVPYQ